LGQSENAVKIQILIALITYMLLAIYKKSSQSKHSLHKLFIILQSALFCNKHTNYYKEKKQQLSYIQQNQLKLNFS
jgi:hypothetical protein